MSRSLLVVAGEISGDQHAARVVKSVRDQCPDWTFWGIGGDGLQAAGVECLYDSRDMAVLGLSEVLRRFSFFRRVFHHLCREMDRRRPDAVLLVDYPGFNLRLARAAHARGIKVIYYICPQVWAWHRSRIARMARWVDRLLVIFPFEVEVFAGTDLHVDFVGHPLVDQARVALAAPLQELPWPAAGPRVALLPGSRRQEVERILPPMWAAARELARTQPAAAFIIAAPSPAIAEAVARVQATLPAGDGPPVAVVTGQTREVLRQARGAMVASGTATIETALMGCPFIVVYKTATLTYWFGKRLIRVPYLGMVNIVAQRLLCPEFLQHDAQPAPMAAALAPLLADGPVREAMIEGLREVAAALGEMDPVTAAADSVLRAVDSRTANERQ